MKTLKVFTGIVLSLSVLASYSQNSSRTISVKEKEDLVNTSMSLLREHYIFPQTVDAMEPAIRKKLTEGGYSMSTTVESFLKDLNTDLETLSSDPHIDVFFDPVRVKQLQADEKDTNTKRSYTKEFLQRARYENYRMRKAERLDGNIGYLNFLSFMDTSLSKTTMTAAMNFLANSNALIIDLRQNGGGDANAVAYLLSYFLPDNTSIMKARNRKNEIRETKITGDKAVTKFKEEIPVYILTSRRTSSAAEAFAYVLQSYKRAVVIGDTTHGEANPGYLFPLNDELYIMIPAFENINPVTSTNWQGKGVFPNVPVSSDKAFTMAYAKACDSLAYTLPDEDLKGMYQWMHDGLLAELQPLMLGDDEMKIYAGNYADQRHIVFDKGCLYYYRGENSNTRKKLLPMKKDLFSVEGLSYFRIHFIKNEKDEVMALEGIYDDGTRQRSGKMK